MGNEERKWFELLIILHVLTLVMTLITRAAAIERLILKAPIVSLSISIRYASMSITLSIST